MKVFVTPSQYQNHLFKDIFVVIHSDYPNRRCKVSERFNRHHHVTESVFCTH